MSHRISLYFVCQRGAHGGLRLCRDGPLTHVLRPMGLARQGIRSGGGGKGRNCPTPLNCLGDPQSEISLVKKMNPRKATQIDVIHLCMIASDEPDKDLQTACRRRTAGSISRWSMMEAAEDPRKAQTRHWSTAEREQIIISMNDSVEKIVERHLRAARKVRKGKQRSRQGARKIPDSGWDCREVPRGALTEFVWSKGLR